VLVDIVIDQGDCAETSRARPPTHAPVFVEEGLTHYSVANMPAANAGTATQALTNGTHRYVEMLANHGLAEACALAPELVGGINTHQSVKDGCEPIAITSSLPILVLGTDPKRFALFSWKTFEGCN
jgi:alanine dehydrogenase